MTGEQFSLSGRVAAVTGTTRGIGQAIALGLAEAGADIVRVDRSPSPEVEGAIADVGRRSRGVEVDLRGTPEGVTRAAEEAIAWRGRIDILVNSAGALARKPALEQTPQMIADVVHLDLLAPFLLSQAFGAPMVARGSGKIINIASLMSFQGGLNVSSYAAAKAGLAGLTRALANEWAPHGVNVNAIAPGYIATDINEDLRADESRSQEIAQRIPAGRWGSPDDLVGAAVFLASEAATYVHGHVLVVDGGWLSR